MAQLKFAVWNIEWMNDLFTGDPPVFKPDADTVRGPKRNNTVAQRKADIAGVINEAAIDVLVIVEGPNRIEELNGFFTQAIVNGDWTCAVQSAGAQSVGIAVRTDTGNFAASPITWFDVMNHDEAKVLKTVTNEFQMDTDDDILKELHKFERRPLYASVNCFDGTSFRVLGIHLKSKGVFDALEWSKWWAKADGNRKKILAQCFQLRTEFLDPYLSDATTKDIPLIVCGDINDGPGFDTSEMKLNASGVERLMGSIWDPSRCLGSALYDTLPDDKKKKQDFKSIYTATFQDPIFAGSYRNSWIDHILYSRNTDNWISNAEIIHDMPDGQRIYTKYPTASDHRPVTCVINTDGIV